MQHQEPTLILNSSQIEKKLNRLAYQIYEQNFDEKSILICGIQPKGYLLAEKIYTILKEISPFSLELAAIEMDKQNPGRQNIKLQPEISDLQNKAVILCDDVLYTGRTLAYATLPFLEAGAKKLQCLVLIDRNHLNFPIHPTFTGLTLATTLQEHVNVNFEEGFVELR